MKTLCFAALSLVLTLLSPVCGLAQNEKEIRQVKKMAKAEAKSLTRDGYKLTEIGDLTTEMEKYLTETLRGKKQLVGISGACVSANLAKITAQNNAINEFVNLSGGMVKARITSDMSDVDGVQRDDFVAAFERIVAADIKNEVKFSFSVIREHHHEFFVRAYALVDRDAMYKAKTKALEQALDELGMKEKYGSNISQWAQD